MLCCDKQSSSESESLSAFAVWRDMVAMQRRGTNVVIGGDRQKLGARELDLTSVVKRNKKQITAVLISLTAFAVLLSKPPYLMRVFWLWHTTCQQCLHLSMHGSNCYPPPLPTPFVPPPSIYILQPLALLASLAWHACGQHGRSTSQPAKAGM